MAIGIRNIYRLIANQAVSASTVLVDVAGLTAPIAKNQKARFRFYIPCAVAGTASGIKFEVITPTPTSLTQSNLILNGSTNAVDKASTITAAAAVVGTLANIANHYAIIEGDVVNGATAGVIKLQFAQSVSDAAAATVLLGATLEIVYE